MITTSTGLQYEDTTEGTGAVAAKGQRVQNGRSAICCARRCKRYR